MDNYFGRITIATTNGEDFHDTMHVSTFELACVEIGTLIKMFPSCAILKCEVINSTNRATVIISEMNETNKFLTYKFVKTKKYNEMYSVLQKRWHSLDEAQTAYDDYMYAGVAFPELK